MRKIKANYLFSADWLCRILIALALGLTLFVKQGHCLNTDKVKAYFLSADYKSAIREGEKLMAGMKKSPPADELYYILGLCYLKDGNYLRASDIFGIIINEYKDSPFKSEAMLGLGDAFFLNGDYQQAEGYYLSLLNDPAAGEFKPQLYSRLSKIKFSQADVAEGNAYRQRLIEEFPFSPEIDSVEDVPLKPGTPESYYTVQVGAFTSRERAERLERELSRHGYPAYCAESPWKQSELIYRVRVGRFRSLQEALALKEELKQRGYPTKIFP